MLDLLKFQILTKNISLIKFFINIYNQSLKYYELFFLRKNLHGPLHKVLTTLFLQSHLVE